MILFSFYVNANTYERTKAQIISRKTISIVPPTSDHLDKPRESLETHLDDRHSYRTPAHFSKRTFHGRANSSTSSRPSKGRRNEGTRRNEEKEPAKTSLGAGPGARTKITIQWMIHQAPGPSLNHVARNNTPDPRIRRAYNIRVCSRARTRVYARYAHIARLRIPEKRERGSRTREIYTRCPVTPKVCSVTRPSRSDY